MRIALIKPAKTNHVGGVQRFADALHEAMEGVCDELETVRFHPEAGHTRLRAASGGFMQLLGMHASRPFDAVVSTFHWPWKLIPTIPMVGFIHDLRQHRLGRVNVTNLVQRGIVSTWDATCVASDHVADEVRALAPSARVHIVGEGLDHLERFRDQEGPDPARDRIVVIAGRAPHKRAGLGLEAAERLVEALDTRAIVLGKLPREPADPRIEKLGRYTDAELVDLYRRARLVIAPTAYEGFGLAAGEAMWFGAPVVYATDGKLGGLVGDGGIAAEPTAEAMAAAGLKVWREGSPLDPTAVAGPYTWEATARAIVEVAAAARTSTRAITSA